MGVRDNWLQLKEEVQASKKKLEKSESFYKCGQFDAFSTVEKWMLQMEAGTFGADEDE